MEEFETLSDKFERLEKKILKEDFQNNAGLSNEIGYYIFTYNPKLELEVRDRIIDLQKNMSSSLSIKIFNIYEVVMDYINHFQYQQPLIQMEKSDGLNEVSVQINNVLEMDEDNNIIVQHINSNLQSTKSVIFLTGIGQIYPILRAHKILNTMTQIIDQYPVIMFYPGNYDGLNLKAFGKVEDSNYYRAFSI
ncbi:DUF1788 domain-containing protein [Bombilactobacillus bombi]|uniref:DUF1788 domain-containing protein n=1 Tax=Bombilactobacillus bombi TaxID=1303590 RepID=UPI002159DA3F|nr:DUF1788 domain-containing protein [Bombilactobacillus bombi]